MNSIGIAEIRIERGVISCRITMGQLIFDANILRGELKSFDSFHSEVKELVKAKLATELESLIKGE